MFARVATLAGWYRGLLLRKWTDSCIFALTSTAGSLAADFINKVTDIYVWAFGAAVAFFVVCFGFALHAAGRDDDGPYPQPHSLSENHFKLLSFSGFGLAALAIVGVVQQVTGLRSVTAEAANDFGLLHGEMVAVRKEMGAVRTGVESIATMLARKQPIASPATPEEFYVNAAIYHGEGRLEAARAAIETLYADFKPNKIDSAALYVDVMASVRGLDAARQMATSLASANDDWRLDFAVAQARTRGDPTDAGPLKAVAQARPDCVICSAEALAPERRISYVGGACTDVEVFEEASTKFGLGIGKAVRYPEEKAAAIAAAGRIRAAAPTIAALRSRLENSALGTQYFDVSNWNRVEARYRENISGALIQYDAMAKACDALVELIDQEAPIGGNPLKRGEQKRQELLADLNAQQEEATRRQLEEFRKQQDAALREQTAAEAKARKRPPPCAFRSNGPTEHVFNCKMAGMTGYRLQINGGGWTNWPVTFAGGESFGFDHTLTGVRRPLKVALFWRHRSGQEYGPFSFAYK